MFGTKLVNEDFPFSTGSRSTQSVGHYSLFEADISESNFDQTERKRTGDLTEYNESLYEFRENFAGSNWRSAIFPPQVRSWLEANAPPTVWEERLRLPCKPRRHNIGQKPAKLSHIPFCGLARNAMSPVGS